MSWSISLNGSKEMVEAELAAAIDALRGAESRVMQLDGFWGAEETISVIASGGACWQEESKSLGASFSVSRTVTAPPTRVSE